MKMKRVTVRRTLKALELPQDLDPHFVSIQWIGGRDLLIEQHRGILRFDSDEIRFASEQGVVSVTGSDLTMEQLTASRALISGDVKSVSIAEKS